MLSGSVVPGIPEWRVEVLVNGVPRKAREASWDTSMGGDLPDQVIASGRLGGTDGTIRWAPQDPVQTRPVSPWAKVAGWPPSRGDLVQIRVSDGVTWWTRYTGVIDRTTGTPTSYESKVIDFRDQITGTFTHEALLRHMVPFIEDGEYRSIGLNHWYPLTSALRSAGFCNVPPIEAPSALSVPLQGSVWPEAGTVTQATGGVGAQASFYYTSFGYAAGDFTARYIPRLSESSSTPVQVTMVIPGTNSGVSTMDIYYGNGAAIRFRVSASRGVNVYYSPTIAGNWTSIVSVGGASSSTDTTVQLLVKGGVWTLRTSNGVQATGSQTMSAGNMDLVIFTADANARVAGMQISHPQSSAREFASVGFVPNMRFQGSGLASTMDMMPAIRGRSIPDLVDEITEATLTAAWWDEEGRLVLVPSDQLRSTSPSATIESGTDITALSWEDSLLSVRSEVEVAWQNPTWSKGRQYRLELWRGPEQSVVNGDDPVVQFVKPESGVEWFGVDRTINKLDSDSWGAFNNRRGSYGGLRYEVIAGSDAGNEVPTTAGAVSVTSENLYADSMVVTTTVHGIVPNVEGISGTSTTATALRPQLRGKALPVVRGLGRGEWVDDSYRTTAGPATAPALVHDLGYWGHEFFTEGSVAQRIGDYLAGMVSAPLPTIPSLGVTYDPRRQVGDVYTLRSEWLRVELRILVVGISEEHGGGSRQTLTVRVISATSIGVVTYDELAAAWGSSNYSGLQAAWSALNYTALSADPLRGAPE